MSSDGRVWDRARIFDFPPVVLFRGGLRRISAIPVKTRGFNEIASDRDSLGTTVRANGKDRNILPSKPFIFSLSSKFCIRVIP